MYDVDWRRRVMIDDGRDRDQDRDQDRDERQWKKDKDQDQDNLFPDRNNLRILEEITSIKDFT